jgi:structure-specific recognition protein 1
MGLGWKDSSSGTIVTVPSKDMSAISWLRVARGYRMEIKLTSSKFLHLENFSKSDHEGLAEVLHSYFSINLVTKDLALNGWNWGKTEFTGTDMSFMVGGATAFTLPMKQVASTSLSNKTEVSMEFTPPAPITDAALKKRSGDTLVELRFHVPGAATRDQLGDPDTPVGEDGEINMDVVLDDNGEPVSAATLFHDTVRERGDVGQIQGEAIVAFQDMLCLTPRGRFEIDLFDDFFRLRGKSHDYKLPYAGITRMFLLPKPDALFWMFIVGLEPPLRQGQTRYPYLVFQFAKVLLYIINF